MRQNEHKYMAWSRNYVVQAYSGSDKTKYGGSARHDPLYNTFGRQICRRFVRASERRGRVCRGLDTLDTQIAAPHTIGTPQRMPRAVRHLLREATVIRARAGHQRVPMLERAPFIGRAVRADVERVEGCGVVSNDMEEEVQAAQQGVEDADEIGSIERAGGGAGRERKREAGVFPGNRTVLLGLLLLLVLGSYAEAGEDRLKHGPEGTTEGKRSGRFQLGSLYTVKKVAASGVEGCQVTKPTFEPSILERRRRTVWSKSFNFVSGNLRPTARAPPPSQKLLALPLSPNLSFFSGTPVGRHPDGSTVRA
ncbi:hypothetical protein B0H17DRAFT_1244394 [Mycena rosella]|uniref:Uncharacterized protein n=1 Tax=Mycena rosella TaxID=1033263 RepID=A0AAD7DWQ0_MYCRO|nr:hypothetical protein B0H17DRAFT_1244394 [Mycena rosella]